MKPFTSAARRVCRAFLPAASNLMMSGSGAQTLSRGLQAPFTSHVCKAGAVATTSETEVVAKPGQKMSGAEIREKFLAFYEGKGHTRLPSSSLVPEDPTVLLTIAGMLQFKPIFLGQAARKVPRATTTQKCVRTNDIENVGVTARHHTFFEMLGNFSFGDYFKKEAIQYAWEISTKVFQVPADRIWVSVFEEDQEALELWRDVVGVPEERIKKMGAADNFWASGPTGPCGPCSELYYDFHPERGTGDAVTLEDDTRFIEFYNLVFMELNRSADGALTPLAAKNIDTGMGLERMAQILQGVSNNYETDLIYPIVSKAASLAGVDYATADAQTKTALKVIGDHTRAVAYLISDGVTPSNVGRGYIVRRLLRRVVMKGRLLGIKDTFTPAVAQVAIDLSGACDPGVAKNASRILDVLTQEEAMFSATLDRGNKQLAEMLTTCEASKATVLAGKDAFLLYDSFGFPLELTQELAEQKGITVDVAAFETEMEAQRARSKDAREEIDLTAQSNLAQLATTLSPTEFIGYENLASEGTVQGLLVGGQPVQSVNAGEAQGNIEVVLDTTPFYAESGGQVGDTGVLQAVPDASTSTSTSGQPAILLVSEVKKAAGGRLFVHSCELQSGSLTVGQKVTAKVEESTRKQSCAHHTATHLLQSALKKVLGPDTCQQGSLVDTQRLRFDFNLPRPMTQSELAEVENLVNAWILQAAPTVTKVMGLPEAKAAGATAMFGEKYDDVVRVVDVPGISMELCGGTHVRNTSEIGLFKVLSESGIASGIRRIEAVSGAAAVEYIRGLDTVVRTLSTSLKVKAEELPSRITTLQTDLKAANKEIEALRAQLSVAKASALVSQAVTSSTGVKVLVAELPDVDAKALGEAAASLLAQLGEPAAVLLGTRASAGGGQANFVATFSKEAVAAGLSAGKVVGAVAKVCGGGGGGKPALAQAGAKDASKVPEALATAKQLLGL